MNGRIDGDGTLWPDPVYHPISWSVFRGLYDSQPLPITQYLSSFAAVWGKPQIGPKLGDQAPMWSPAKWPKTALRRLGCDVIDVSCLVLDFDKGTTLAEEAERWKGHYFIIHTSFSHTPEHHRFRMILPFQTPVPRDEWPEVWAWAQSLSPAIDPKCKDVGHVYALPRAPVRANYSWAINHGHPLLVPGRIAQGQQAAGLPVVRKPRAENTSTGLVEYTPTTPEGHERLRVAVALGGEVNPDGVARKVLCPGCGRRSVWFFIEPAKKKTASCGHDTCGYWHVDVLEREVARCSIRTG